MDHDGDTDGELLSLLLLLLTLRSSSVMSSERSCYFLITLGAGRQAGRQAGTHTHTQREVSGGRG